MKLKRLGGVEGKGKKRSEDGWEKLEKKIEKWGRRIKK